MSPRLSNKDRLKRLLDIFVHDDRVLLPIVADPDAIASALAFRRLLWRKVGSVTIARINEIKRQDNLTLLRLLRINLIRFEEVKPDEFSSFVLLDGQPEHNQILAQLSYDAIIDHHPLLDSTDAGVMDIRPGYGATATIMTEYLRAAKITPSRSLATALFYAVKTDTDSFRRPALEEDMRAFRYLYGLADQNLIRKIEYSEIPLSLVKYYGQALDRLKIRKDKGFAFLGRISTPDVLVMIADFLMRVNIIDTSIAAGIWEEKLIVIFRNAKGRRNVGRLAQRAFGRLGEAGGHKAAARAEIPLAALKSAGHSLSDESLEKMVIRTVQGRLG
jgi:nanoRNase/pAp phosphatase (c-di-AMP/oligoRNAs hydrolase)